MGRELGRLIKVPNRFEEEFGELPEEKRKNVVSILRIFMTRIRQEGSKSQKFVQEVKTLPVIGEQCETCAFAPEIDHHEFFVATAYALLDSILGDKGFLCHDNQPVWTEQKNTVDTDKLLLCRGFQAIRLCRGRAAVMIAFEAMTAIGVVVSE